MRSSMIGRVLEQVGRSMQGGRATGRRTGGGYARPGGGYAAGRSARRSGGLMSIARRFLR